MPDDPEDLPSYEVRLTEPAEVEIEKAYLSRMKFGARSADEWYAGLGSALERLSYLPRGYPLASESDALEGEVRQMIYGKGAWRTGCSTASSSPTRRGRRGSSASSTCATRCARIRPLMTKTCEAIP
jgi:plasmid stabilization system protein ParE